MINRRGIVFFVGLCLALPARGTRRASQALRSPWGGGGAPPRKAARTDRAGAAAGRGAPSRTRGPPARDRALVQEFVEQRKVIGFVGNPEALTGQGSVDYLTKAGIPVVGSEGAGQWFYESPTYFPQGSTGNALLQAGAYLAAVTNKPH